MAFPENVILFCSLIWCVHLLSLQSFQRESRGEGLRSCDRGGIRSLTCGYRVTDSC